MAGFRNVADYARAWSEGRTSQATFRKVPSQASTARWWVDLSMAAGIPVPNYYASEPLVAARLNARKGIWPGDDKAPASRHLTEIGMVTPTAGLVGRYRLLDYLLYYPFVDGDSIDLQETDNTVTLPRYTDGDGVLAMVVATAPTTGGGAFTYSYVDDAGNAQTSPSIAFSTASASIASLATSQQAVASGGLPFLPMASGSKGIRRITGVQLSSATGGNMAFVLVKPIADFAILEARTPVVQQYVREMPGAPRIYDGAYLGLIMNCAATVAAGIVVGTITTAWSA